MKRHYISLITVCGILFSCGWLFSGADISALLPNIAKPNFQNADLRKVLRVVDGDTIIVSGKLNTKEKVRLIGVDTPETVDPRKAVQEYGKEASRFTQNLLRGEKVYMVYENKVKSFGKYGRTLAYIYRYPDGLFVNAEIIRQGYGHAYTKYPFRLMSKFRQLEKFARIAGKGLWHNNKHSYTSEKVTQEQNQSTIVYITKSGSKYHKAGCRYLRRSMIPIQLNEAKKRYSPCSVCNPPH